MSEKWLEFCVEEECEHSPDVYNGCPLCRVEYLETNVELLKEQRDSFEGSVNAAFKEIERLRLRIEDSESDKRCAADNIERPHIADMLRRSADEDRKALEYK